MKLRKIALHNFQSHKHTEVDLGDLTLIVGSSNAGKSAIIRALKWIATNRPTSTTGLKSYFADDSEPVWVEVEIESNGQIHRVKRFKSSTENYYEVDGVKYKALRSDVPDEVKQVLKLSDLNFQFQHDKHFLISDTPSSRRQFLNSVLGLELAEKLITLARSHYTSYRRELKRLTEEELEVKNTLNFLKEKQGKIEDYYKCYTEISNEIDTLQDQIQNLESVLQNISQVQQILSQYSSVEELGSVLEQCVDVSDELQIVEEKFRQLRALLLELRKCRETVRYLKKVDSLSALIERYSEIANQSAAVASEYNKLSQLVHDITAVKGKLEEFHRLPELKDVYTQYENTLLQYSTVEKEYTALYKMLASVSRSVKQLKVCKRQITSLESKFYQEIGETCPLCGQPIKK